MDGKLAVAVLFSIPWMVFVWSPAAAGEEVPQIGISASPPEITIHEGDCPEGNFDIRINNSGDQSVKLKLAGDRLPANWSLRFSMNGSPVDSIVVGPRASTNFTAEAFAPWLTPAGPYALSCNISDDRGHSWELPLAVNVRQIYDIDIYCSYYVGDEVEHIGLWKKPGIPGGTVEFKFILGNRGNGPDNVSFYCGRPPPGFGCAFYHNGSLFNDLDELVIAAYQRENMTLRVTVPAGRADGDVEIFVFATSKCGLMDQMKFVVQIGQNPANVDLDVGPFTDEAGDPVGGALVSLSNAGGRWSNLSGGTGVAVIAVHPSCLDTDVTVTATHPQYEDVEFPGTVGLSDLSPTGGVYPVFIKRPRILVGPIIGSDGKPVGNASIGLSDGVRTFSGATNADGMAGIYIPKGLLGKPVHLTIGCNGFADGIADGNVSAEGGFKPAGGAYPVLEKTVPAGPANGHTPLASVPVLWIGFGAGLLIVGGLLAGTEVGKMGLFSFIMPLYSRVNKDKVLDNFSRGTVYGHVVEHPGINFTELKGLSNIASGTLTYHLKVLEGEGLIVAHNRGTRRIFFATSINASTRDLVLNKSEQMVFSMISANPGISQAGIAEEADLSESTIHRIVGSLELKGLVSVEKGGRNRCFVRTGPTGTEAAVAAPPIFPAKM